MLNTYGSVYGEKGGTGGLIRDCQGAWIACFYGFAGNVDILEAELIAILQGLRLCWDLEKHQLSCLTYSKLADQLFHQQISPFHKHATLIKEIQIYLAKDWNVTITHTLREGNYCADFLAKFGADSDSPLCQLQVPSPGLVSLLQADAFGVLYPVFS
ncbi:Ribonuclease H domain [Sesbania bispinosa]|nr:Ribonuclease H domain [Sesbania bispinosa]